MFNPRIDVFVIGFMFVAISLGVGFGVGYQRGYNEGLKETEQHLLEMGIAQYHPSTGELMIKNKNEFDLDKFFDDFESSVKRFEDLIENF